MTLPKLIEQRRGFMKKQEAQISRVLDALKSSSKEKRWEAAIVLGRLGVKSAVDPLITALEENDDVLRFNAIYSLGQLKALSAIEPLFSILTSPYEAISLRECAGWAIGQTKTKDAIEKLITLLQDEQEDFQLRASIAETLGEIGNTNALTTLIKALKDDFDLVQIKAAIALGRLGDKRAVEPLIETLFNNKIAWLPSYAAESLALLADERAIDPLIEVLKSSSSNTRYAAAKALGNLKSIKALPILIQIAEKDNEIPYNCHEAVSNAASEAIEFIRQNVSI